MSRLPLYLMTAAAPLRPLWPHYLVLFVTSRCNARCRMCFNWPALEKAGEGDLTLEELQEIAGHWPGLIQLTLSGGEPFLRDDLVEVAAAFVERSGVRQLTIPTNGILTERIAAAAEEILRRFPGLPCNLYLSLDAIGEEHDRIRQVPGAYAAVKKTFARLQALRRQFPNLSLGVTTVLMAENQDRITAILEQLAREFPCERYQVELARGKTREPGSGQVDLARYEEAARWLREQAPAGLRARLAGRMRETLIRTVSEKRMVIPCLAGRQLVVVEADGTVRPCEILHTLGAPGLAPEGLLDPALGNLRQAGYRIAEILDSPRAGQIRDFIARRRCHCSYECALYASLVFSPRRWLSILISY